MTSEHAPNSVHSQWICLSIDSTSSNHILVKGINKLYILLWTENVINHKDEEGFTPLMWAAAHGQIAVVEFLLQNVRKKSTPHFKFLHFLCSLFSLRFVSSTIYLKLVKFSVKFHFQTNWLTCFFFFFSIISGCRSSDFGERERKCSLTGLQQRVHRYCENAARLWSWCQWVWLGKTLAWIYIGVCFGQNFKAEHSVGLDFKLFSQPYIGCPLIT